MLDDIEKTIAGELDRVIVEEEQTRGMAAEQWTRRIKDRVCDIGHQKGLSICADRCDGADTGELLFDLIWAQRQSNPERLISISLVMEVKWDPYLEEILGDLKKLLVAKAQHKVLVFRQTTTEKVRNLMTILEDRVNHFQSRSPKERYLLAGYAYDDRIYVYRSV